MARCKTNLDNILHDDIDEVILREIEKNRREIKKVFELNAIIAKSLSEFTTLRKENLDKLRKLGVIVRRY